MRLSGPDTILPIRARSTLSSAYEFLADKPAAQSAQTRASLLHRKETSAAKERQRSLPLFEFVHSLREEVRGFPLTIVIHGWPTPSAREFLEVPGLLEKRDALWLVTTVTDAKSITPIGGAVILKPDVDGAENSSRLYDNLVADIAYFPAVEEDEVRHLARIQKRARAILIDNGGALNLKLLGLLEKRVRRYLWAADNVFVIGRSILNLPAEDKTTTPTLSPEIDQIGKMLKELSTYLAVETDRRFEFRSYIERVRRKFPEQSQFRLQLVQTANVHDWPSWAVESLPSLYLPTRNFPDGGVTALVWSRIFKCLPKETKIWSELCNGQFLEVKLSKELADRAEKIARTIEDNLARNPYPSDSAFFGTINQALMEIDEESEESD